MSDDRQKDIEQGEEWLRSICRDTRTIDVECIKRSVRLAMDERWLSDELSDVVPPSLISRTKETVRTACGKSAPILRRDKRNRIWFTRRWIQWSASLATAAAVACFLFVNWSARFAEASDDAIAAFEEFESDELSPSLAMFQEDLSTFEEPQSVGGSARMEVDEYNDIRDAIDMLMGPEEIFNDWS